MNTVMKQYNRALVVSLIVIMMFVQLSTVIFAEPASTDEVLVFLNDVVNLDVTRYDVTLVTSIVRNPPELGGLAQETRKYSLDASGSRIDVLVKFRDNVLSWCLMRVQEGSPYYNEQLSTNVCDLAKGFLQRHQTCTGDSDLVKMKNMLDVVDNVTSTTKIEDNLKLEITVDSSSTSFEWRYTFNGADYSGLVLSFKNGSFHTFSDDRSYYEIGGTDVNVNEEKAKSIALEHAKKISWSYEGKNVTQFNITEDRISTELLTRSRSPLTLYPYWLIILPLDDIYPGLISSIMVLIWADTAEIIDCQPLVYGGMVQVEDTSANDLLDPEESITETIVNESSQVSNTSQALTTKIEDDLLSIDNTPVVATIVATIIVGVMMIGILFKKKHEKDK